MAPRNKQKPGRARGGIEHILQDEFRVPMRPTLDRATLVERIQQALRERNISWDAIHLSDAPVHRDALFDARGKRVAFPEGSAYERCFVALVDPDERARWAHPAHWAFIPADGSEPVEIRDTSLPEHPRGPVRLNRLS
jgi:hypothetical protein